MALASDLEGMNGPTRSLGQRVGVDTYFLSQIDLTVLSGHEGGEVVAGLADVAIVEEHLTPSLVASHRRLISVAPLVLLDANLTSAAIEVSKFQTDI